jgi:hypothetical protein
MIFDVIKKSPAMVAALNRRGVFGSARRPREDLGNDCADFVNGPDILPRIFSMGRIGGVDIGSGLRAGMECLPDWDRCRSFSF